MRKCIRFTMLCSLVMTTFQLTAQKTLTLKQVNKRLDASQQNFTKSLDKSLLDKNGKTMLSRFITTETDSLQKVIKNDNKLTDVQKIQALACQCYFLDTLQSEINNKQFDAGLIRESRDNFIPIWQTILQQKSTDYILRSLSPKTADLMAVVFKEYPQNGRIKEIATLKSLERTPENIMAFLSNNPNYALRDSLIFIYANTQPEKLVTYVLESKNAELVKLIRDNSSPVVQTLLSIANEKNLKNYFPFVGQLTEQKITLAEIDKMRAQPSLYFKSIVDIELANQEKILAGAVPIYAVATQKYVKDYAKLFFTDIINSLHEESNEKIRYAVLEDLRPQDMYFIITTGEDELFTSSYLYTYKKLMGTFEKSGSDQLFELVKYDQYRKFLLMAGRYNTLASFLKLMSTDKSLSIIKKLLYRLEDKDYNSLREIINIAETFPGIVSDKNLSSSTFREIQNNYDRSLKAANSNGIKVYNLLSDIFRVVEGNETGNMSVIPQAIAMYFKITHSTLVGKDGKINQLILFFGDEDGKSSYASFLSNYSDASQWSIEKNDSWVKISSKKLQPISIYANLPLNNDDGQDLKAQDILQQHLKELRVEPSILILRGHSYHLINSFKFFSPSIQLGILGSCGGYTEIIEILKKNKRVQVVSTKQIGSKQVNEPMLRLLNAKLLNGQDLIWSELWDKLEDQFKGNKLLNDYFKEYVPPYKNIALLVTALYEQSGLKESPFL